MAILWTIGFGYIFICRLLFAVIIDESNNNQNETTIIVSNINNSSEIDNNNETSSIVDLPSHDDSIITSQESFNKFSITLSPTSTKSSMNDAEFRSFATMNDDDLILINNDHDIHINEILHNDHEHMISINYHKMCQVNE